MNKPVILTGLRANNDLHLGNYLGALLPLIDLAKSLAGEYQINLFVPDLHSFTTPIDHASLQETVMNNVKLFVAAGLPIDNPDVHIYRQSYIPAHSELTWILDCFTGMGEMRRMTQFKEKSAMLQADRVSVGLFHYPVLMAADILLYDASYVPVGDDQTQHLEFVRVIAERLNKRFKQELFTVPKPVKEQHTFFGNDQGLRIKDLVDPTKKMSKSSTNYKGTIFLTDNPDTARGFNDTATTDSYGRISYNPEKQPGVTNLLDLLALLSAQPIEEIKKKYEGQIEYGPLKVTLGDIVSKFLVDFQRASISVDTNTLLTKLEESERLMNVQANTKLHLVQQVVGLRG
jgi:tryptophanyl-tRNA synthetase